MPFLLLKKLPRFEILMEASRLFPSLNPVACEVFLNLLRTGDLLFTAEAEYLAGYKISHGRFTVMMILLRRPEGCGAAELAECAGVARATITGLLDILERDGRVHREPEPDDRRAVRVALTEKGRAEMQALLPGYFERVAKMMEPLSEMERKALVQLIQKIQRGFPGVELNADFAADPTAQPIPVL
jgi:DNA-binding MarR family transcriptional regulator